MTSPRCLIWITTVLLICGCQTGLTGPAQTPVQTKAGAFVSAQVLRRLDYTGLTHDDQLEVNTPKGLATLAAFFPAMGTRQTSAMHGGWTPWIIVRFRTADGKDVTVGSDYRLYRVGDGQSGDFVLDDGFHEYIDRIYNDPTLVDRSWVKTP